MWYVMQVYTGSETEVCEQCRKRIIREGEEVFVLLAERMTKIRGEWSLVTSRLFPGYVFIDTEKIRDFYDRLKSIESMTKILRTGDEMTPVYPEEEDYFRAIGGERHIVRYSQGYIQGEQLVITSGAMRDCRGRVKKILRHKRLVVLEVSLMGRLVEVTVGMGIVSRDGNSGKVQMAESQKGMAGGKT